MSGCEGCDSDGCDCNETVPKRQYEVLVERLEAVEAEFIALLNELYQLEDPRGGCVIQNLRLRGAEVMDHDSRNVPKKAHVRAEFERSLATS